VVEGDADAWRGEIDAARRAFAFLVEELGAAPPTVSAGMRECALIWTLPGAQVRLFFEAFAAPHLGVRIRSDEEPRRVLAELPLSLLVREALPPEEEALGALPAATDESLARLADLLRRAAADLLGGDRTRVTRLRAAAAADRRRRDRERFGTSTGETPRFAHRPTLAELFADVSNDGLRSPRAYQAVWDYDYARAEIAAFLGCDEAAVQALLDQWEGV
jgi:hypothetical protein